MTVNVSILQEETGKRIKELMKKNNLKVRDLQEACGFEQPQAVYKWLSGQCLPSVDNLVILSYILHTKIDGILVTGGDAAFLSHIHFQSLCAVLVTGNAKGCVADADHSPTLPVGVEHCSTPEIPLTSIPTNNPAGRFCISARARLG